MSKIGHPEDRGDRRKERRAVDGRQGRERPENRAQYPLLTRAGRFDIIPTMGWPFSPRCFGSGAERWHRQPFHGRGPYVVDTFVR
jgi:hypothetical protein